MSSLHRVLNCLSFLHLCICINECNCLCRVSATTSWVWLIWRAGIDGMISRWADNAVSCMECCGYIALDGGREDIKGYDGRRHAILEVLAMGCYSWAAGALANMMSFGGLHRTANCLRRREISWDELSGTSKHSRSIFYISIWYRRYFWANKNTLICL